MPLRRATNETLCPGSRLSRTMVSFCSGLQRRRRSRPKSSPLLSLLLVINITVCLSLIVRGKRRSEEHTSELQSLLLISYAVFCLTNKLITHTTQHPIRHHQISTPIVL